MLRHGALSGGVWGGEFDEIVELATADDPGDWEASNFLSVVYIVFREAGTEAALEDCGRMRKRQRGGQKPC
jgi:hypothetical protein